METPWVSTGIWWVSSFRVWFALGFLRVSAWPPWVSTGILAFGLACLCLCYGFPQVCVHIRLASCLNFHRLPCDFAVALLYGPVRFASQHALLVLDLLSCALWVTYGLPVGFARASCRFPMGFQLASCRFPASFLRVSCGFPARFLRVSCRFPVGFLSASRGRPIGFPFLEGFLKVSGQSPVGGLQVSCNFLVR